LSFAGKVMIGDRYFRRHMVTAQAASRLKRPFGTAAKR